MAKQLRRVAIWSVVGFIALLLVVIIASVAVGWLAAHGTLERETAHLWVLVPFGAIMMIGSIWIGVAWMRSIDEAAREAHKAAWFWGGSTGMAVGGFLIIVAGLEDAARVQLPTFFTDRADPAAYAASGAFAMMLLMMVGYTIVWAWWWWRRR